MIDKIDQVLELDDGLILGECNSLPPEEAPLVAYEWENEIVKDETKVEITDDQKKDYNYSRTTMRSLLEKSNVALDSVLAIAQETKHPRAIEVASGLIKNMSDISKDLMALHKQMRDLDPTPPTGPQSGEGEGGGTTNNTLVVSSTKELLQMLRAQQLEDEKVIDGETVNSKTEE